MKTTIHALVLISIVLFQFCATEPKASEDNANTNMAIDSLLHTYYKTMSDRNWEAYKNFFWEDATLTTVWQVEGESEPKVHISTIDEFISQTHLGPDSQPIFEENMLNAEITVKKDLAQAWVKYEAKFGTEENLMEWKGTDLFSFMQHDGEWRIVALVFSQD